MTIIHRTFATRRLLVVALAGAVSLAACGSSWASGSGESATTAQAKAAATSAASSAGSSEDSTSAASTASTAKTTAASSTETTTKSTTASTAKSSGGTADAGALADGMVAAFNAVAKGDCGKAKSIGDDMDVKPASADATAEFQALGTALDKLASSGPSDLRDDFGVMAKAFGGMAKAYEDLGLGDPAKLATVMTDPAKAAELAKLGQQMDATDVKAASDHISAWIEEKCPGLENS